MTLRKLIGLSGVAKNENFLAQIWGRRFEFWMVLIAIWLPLQWQMERTHILPKLIITIGNWTVWSFFVIETTVLLNLVHDKRRYISNNWMNPIIIILGMPLIWNHTPLLGILRGLQLLIMVRLILPWWDSCLHILSRNKLGTTLVVALILTTLWGVVISLVEPSITNPWNGIWWAWETVTTVGYGDMVPKTIFGRILAIMLMIMGVGLLSLLTANFSAYFISKGTAKLEKEEDEILILVRELHKRLEKIEQQLQNRELK